MGKAPLNSRQQLLRSTVQTYALLHQVSRTFGISATEQQLAAAQDQQRVQALALLHQVGRTFGISATEQQLAAAQDQQRVQALALLY